VRWYSSQIASGSKAFSQHKQYLNFTAFGIFWSWFQYQLCGTTIKNGFCHHRLPEIEGPAVDAAGQNCNNLAPAAIFLANLLR